MTGTEKALGSANVLLWSGDYRLELFHTCALTDKQQKDCFEGLGTFDMKPYHRDLNPNVEPVIHTPRTALVLLHDVFRKQVDTKVELGMLIPVSEPTGWINSIVLFETTNGKGEVSKIRVCLEPCDVNKTIKHEHHYTKTTD